MHRRYAGRLGLAALLTLTLAACCSRKWTLTEPGEQALAAARPQPVNLRIEYDACELSDSTVALMERAAMILGDEEKALIDYQARINRALTDGERGALVAKRDVLVDGMVSQTDQLKKVVQHAAPGGGTSSIAVVYTAIDVKALTEVPVITARFGYVASIGPAETPAGIVVRQVTPRHALSGLVDEMERFAREQEVLTTETKQRLLQE